MASKNNKNTLLGRKRLHELGGQTADQVNHDKKSQLLAMKVQQMQEEAAKNDQLTSIALSRITPDVNQPRKTFHDIDALANSIAQHGLLQPIIVTPLQTDNLHHIIVGERRYRAARQIGLETIPCIVRASQDADILILQLLENDQRQNVSPFEEADALVQLIQQQKMDKKSVAQAIGRQPSWVSMRLSIHGASEAVRQASQQHQIQDVRTLYELKKFENDCPQGANDFLKKLEQEKVTGSYRQAVLRAKEHWLKKMQAIPGHDFNVSKSHHVTEITPVDQNSVSIKFASGKTESLRFDQSALVELKKWLTS